MKPVGWKVVRNAFTDPADFTCVDAAIDLSLIHRHAGDYKTFFKCRFLRYELQYIQSFLKFVRGEEQGELVSSIEVAFQSADVEMENAFKEGGLDSLYAVHDKLRRKVRLFRARITEAYGYSASSSMGSFTPGRGPYVRIEKNDEYSTCVDSLINTITTRYDLTRCLSVNWSEVEKGLKSIQLFLTFGPVWNDADKLIVGLCVEDPFKMVEMNIENAVKMGDFEELSALGTSLLEKISLANRVITQAYDSLSEDKLFENDEPFVILIPEPNRWSLFFNFLTSSLKLTVSKIGHKGLLEKFYDVVRVVLYFGNAYINYTCKWDGTQIWRLGRLMDGCAVCIARYLFFWDVEVINEEDASIAILNLRRRMRHIFPEIFDLYMQPLMVINQEDAKHIVDIILPPDDRSLQTHRDGLHLVIDYLLGSYSTHQDEDMKLLRLDVEKVVRDDIQGTYDGDQFLRKIELLKEEVDLRIRISRSDSIEAGLTVLESIYMGLLSIQSFVSLSVESVSAKSTLVLERMEKVHGEVASLKAGSNKFCEALKLKLFIEFKIMKIQFFLMEQCSPDLVVTLEDMINTFNEELNFLHNYLSYLPTENQGYEKNIISCLDILASEKPHPYYIPRLNQVPQCFINKMSMFFTTWLKEVSHLNSKIQDIAREYQSSLLPTLPKTHLGLDFVDMSLEKFRGLMLHGADLLGDSTKHQIEAVLEELESFLVMNEAGEKRCQNLQLREPIIMAVREGDYIIDQILLVQWDMKHAFWLHVVINDMKRLNSVLAKPVQVNNDSREIHVSEKQIIATQASRALEVGQSVISLQDQEEIIINQLIAGSTSKRRNVVTISGMPGIGKTTLAKRVYDDPRVKRHFQKLAWCCVSQVYRKREILLKILSDVNKSNNDEVDKKSDDDLLDMLYKSLKGASRYCVVMDDVWSNQVWEELAIAFPDDKNGSRIIITTRNQEVGLKAQPDSVPHTLRSLTKDESWKLLQQKVFQADMCPPELQKIGLMIAEGCKGLPLSLVAIAGILKTKEKKVYLWEQTERDLNSRIFENPEIQCMHILGLSYKDLPDDLKPCFLYFAAFGGDSEVSVKRLIQLWIAEGFVRDIHDRNALLEDVAEIYVMNLIARSLLMVVKRGSDGRVKACRAHDMLYKVCLKKVEEDNFVQYVSGYDELFPSANRQLDYGVDKEYSPVLAAFEQHRLSFCSKRKNFVMLKPSGPSTRTLLFNATSDTFPRCPYHDVQYITENFKILSILDIDSINIGSAFPKRIELLYPLRYLGICGDMRFVPSTIAKLWNLETFVVKGLMGSVTLPDTLWSMSKLRHLHVTTQANFTLLDGIQNTSELSNMVSLSCPALYHGDNSMEVMKLFPKLRKLRCTFSESAHHFEKNINFPTLEFLVELESLKVIYYGHLHQYCQLKGVKFPRNLKKLSLSEFSFTWDDFSTIGKLPNLKILKLVSITFDSPTWEMADDEFQQLEYLRLDSLKIIEWNVESYPVPNIKNVVLRNCIRLEEVPASFAGIATLEMIELKWCCESAENSVMKILEQKLDYGDKDFKALINGFVADPDFSVDD